ncbi:MAG: hypothetical protein JWN85_4009, partial [Gammaproteobacteria bacterium]|nr:hypothetical protein [Gammaproteobacteria bacterium]
KRTPEALQQCMAVQAGGNGGTIEMKHGLPAQVGERSPGGTLPPGFS